MFRVSKHHLCQFLDERNVFRVYKLLRSEWFTIIERLTIVCSSTAVDLNFEFPPIRSAAPTTYPQSNFQEVPLLKIKIYGNALSGSATHLQHTSTVDWRTWLELNIMPKPLVLDMFIFVWVFLRVLLSSFARDWAQEIIKLM